MHKFVKCGALACSGTGLFISGAVAADMMVMHNQENAKAPFASSVMVPAGYDTYYISGSAGKGADTAAQTAATLEDSKASWPSWASLSAMWSRRMSFWWATPQRAARWTLPA